LLGEQADKQIASEPLHTARRVQLLRNTRRSIHSVSGAAT
jgi:hypothetical protein